MAHREQIFLVLFGGSVENSCHSAVLAGPEKREAARCPGRPDFLHRDRLGGLRGGAAHFLEGLEPAEKGIVVM